VSVPPRIVSLLPSASECVHLLGLGHALVGRSHECDAPEGVLAVPSCTRSLVREGTGAEIDADVRRRLAEGRPLYELDRARIQALAPTHIVTQAQCDVCAIGEREVEALLADDWPGPRPEVIALAPRTFGDVFADLQRLGHALGVASAGRAAAAKLANRVSTVGEKTGAGAVRPRVLCLEWLDPPIVAGNWMPEIVRIAGGDPLFGRTGEPSGDVTWAEIEAAQPDFVLVMPCGFDLERTLDEALALAEVPEWPRLDAVRNGRATAVDGNAYFNRSGPRLVDSLELLAELLAPERFSFGWKDAASQVWSPDARAPRVQPSSPPASSSEASG
jgi:iron complex transport system substrate-binding protein